MWHKIRNILTLIFVCACFVTLLIPPAYCNLTYTGFPYISSTFNFTINAVDHKLYAWMGTYIGVFDLDPVQGTLKYGSPVQLVSCDITVYSLALDAMKRKLYAGGSPNNSIRIYDITDSGLLSYPPRNHSHYISSPYIRSLHIDFARNLLFSSGWNYAGVGVSQLGSDGLPLVDTGSVYPVANVHSYIMLQDAVKGVLYHGGNGNSGSYAVLNANGMPDTPAWKNVGYGSVSSGAIDSVNKVVYFPAGTYLNIWRLKDDGTPDTSAFDSSPMNAYCIAVDPVRRKLFGGYVWNLVPYHIAYYSLGSNGKIITMIDSGQTYTSGTTDGMAYEPFYNKVFIHVGANANTFVAYEGPDSAMTPIKINDGETWTDNASITLKFQCANPVFMCVSGSLLSIGSPVNTVGSWVSCGGGFWKNAEDTTRSLTLQTPAVLSSDFGDKTVEVWYVGSVSGYNNMNFTGMMRKAVASISYIEKYSTVTSLSLSKTVYDGARIDYTVRDSKLRPVTATVQYRVSSTEWKDVAIGMAGEGLTNLITSNTGTAHYVLWDIEKDLPENAKDVQVRVRASNGDSDGAWVETAKYSVPDWTGSDLRVINVSIRKPDSNWSFRARLEWTSGISNAEAGDTGVEYEIQKKNDDGSWEWIASTSGTLYEIENLSDTPMYSFRARLRTREGLFSSWSRTVKIRLTRRLYGTSVIGKTGGKAFLEDFDENDANNARVEMDEGTFMEDVSVTIEQFSDKTYEITGRKNNGQNVINKDFRKPVTLRLRYDREEISGLGWKETELSIYYFDGMKWFSIGGTVDKTNCLVIAKVNHFSLYKVAKNVSNPSVSVIPDCFSPNGDNINDELRFYFPSQDMVERAEIRIYNIDGKVIKVIKPNGLNTSSWNGRDENGVLCETGLYLCVIDAGGSKTIKTVTLVK